MDIVSDRRLNPFGLQPPCPDGKAVCGYGDPGADFHVIGDNPGVHGGEGTGIPFTESTAGQRLQSVLREVGFLAREYADQPAVSNLFMSYVYMCVRSDGSPPTPAAYADMERFFDAELRAVNAHVLLPVGQLATDLILEGYTTRAAKEPPAMEDRHARDIRGRGFLVVPIKEPTAWNAGDRQALVRTLEWLLASDYRQTKGVATLVG